jgi:hypothetical protein
VDFDSITVPVVKGLSCAQIEKEASQFLELLAPECLKNPGPTPVLEIFENKMELLNFTVLIGKNIKGLGGLTDVTHRIIELPCSTYKKLEKGDPQARFTAAHEFGHAQLHGKDQALGTFPFRDHITFAYRSRIRAFEDPEWQANSFAAAILMPIKTMRVLHDQGNLTSNCVMEIFKVSWPAANRRILRLQELRWRKPL